MRCLHAGESHGPALVSVIEGFPAGVPLGEGDLDAELGRRLEGYGRGIRAQTIETDACRILAGLWKGRTLGSPLALLIENRDFARREGRPHPDWPAPRPGHADLPGRLRYGYDGFAPVAERASARSTAGVVAAGACAKVLLKQLGIEVWSHTARVGDVAAADVAPTLARLRRVRAGTPLRCLDRRAEALMVAAVDAAAAAGTTLGGVAEVVAFGVPAGLGTYVQPDRRLDARLAGALAGIPSVKAAEIGDGAAVAARDGRSAHDELLPDGRGGARRETNRAGGLEGGVTNGEPVRVRAYVKPISTQREGLRSVDLRTGRARRATWVRSDTCVVAAAGVVAEAVVAWELARELVAVLGDVPLPELKSRLRALRDRQERT
ncbi:MAG: chorismate synthase [bacterium]|nr:chorismate synthase [bacterium]